MANNFSGATEHSAEFFGESRDYWWNQDYLRLVLKRVQAVKCTTILDVGCGVGHWGRLLASNLLQGGNLTGIDREARWVAEAQQQFKVSGWKADYLQAPGENIPFAANTFDLVTCQTVLIHVASAQKVLIEMSRVLKPGGLILLAEPNNLLAPLTVDLAAVNASHEQTLGLVELLNSFIRGKYVLGEGDETIGEKLPGLLSAMGLEILNVSLNDRASYLIPPYVTPAQRAMLDDVQNWAHRDFWIRDRNEFKRYYLAGGGKEDKFEDLWSLALWLNKRLAEGILANTFSCSGGSQTYLVAARKRKELS